MTHVTIARDQESRRLISLLVFLLPEDSVRQRTDAGETGRYTPYRVGKQDGLTNGLTTYQLAGRRQRIEAPGENYPPQARIGDKIRRT
jgi:hypothetical protein